MHLVVVGPGGGVKGFMRALRSHKVDVDGARKPCLERKATALYEGTMTAPVVLHVGLRPTWTRGRSRE